jgi:hypothetical protein
MRRASLILGAGTALALLFGGAAGARAELLVGLTTNNRLVTFDHTTPGTILADVAVSGLIGGDTLVGFDRRPATGQLFGLGSGSRLYLIDQITGQATQVGADGAFTLNGTSFGFDFNPTVDRIRVVSDADQNIRLNPNNGTLVDSDPITPGIQPDTNLAYDSTTADGDPIDVNVGANPNVTASGYTNSVAGATTTTLFGIDTVLDILVTQIPPNGGVLNTIGALGVDTGVDTAFEISGQTGTAYAALRVPGGAGSSTLYTIDLATGAATPLGAISGAPLVGLATIPEPSSFVLAGIGGLAVLGAAWRRNRKARTR